jgi:hypothetical protein
MSRQRCAAAAFRATLARHCHHLFSGVETARTAAGPFPLVRRPGLHAAERELAVRGEPGDADADEAQRSRPVAQPTVEQPARESPI